MEIRTLPENVHGVAVSTDGQHHFLDSGRRSFKFDPPARCVAFAETVVDPTDSRLEAERRGKRLGCETVYVSRVARYPRAEAFPYAGQSYCYAVFVPSLNIDNL